MCYKCGSNAALSEPGPDDNQLYQVSVQILIVVIPNSLFEARLSCFLVTLAGFRSCPRSETPEQPSNGMLDTCLNLLSRFINSRYVLAFRQHASTLARSDNMRRWKPAVLRHSGPSTAFAPLSALTRDLACPQWTPHSRASTGLRPHSWLPPLNSCRLRARWLSGSTQRLPKAARGCSGPLSLATERPGIQTTLLKQQRIPSTQRVRHCTVYVSTLIYYSRKWIWYCKGMCQYELCQRRTLPARQRNNGSGQRQQEQLRAARRPPLRSRWKRPAASQRDGGGGPKRV